MRPVLYVLAALLSLLPTLANSQESKYYDLAKGRFSARRRGRPEGRGLVRRAESSALPAASIRPPVRSSAFRSARIPRRMASSSGRTARPGSPTADRTPSCASIPPRKRSRCGRCRPSACPTPISTPPPSMARAASGSPDRTASMAGSIPKSGDMKVWDAPKGRGAYGITGTPKGDIWFVSLAGSYLANVDLETGAATVYEPPTKDQGARRVWSDSKGRLWVSEWNSGNVSVYDPAAKSWKQWKLPGEKPRTYAVWVDPDDKVWLADWTRQCDRALRSRDREVRELPERPPELQCAPDARPQGRGVDRHPPLPQPARRARRPRARCRRRSRPPRRARARRAARMRCERSRARRSGSPIAT